MDNEAERQAKPSSYLSYLPAVYQQDPFLGEFLSIFEEILKPIQRTVGGLPTIFDPRLAPEPMVNFLATWVGSHRPAGCPDDSWRQTVRQTIWLHRWRGTKRGLRRALEIITGERPLITEFGGTLAIGNDASLGINTVVTDASGSHITVTFLCSPDDVDIVLIAGIIRQYKPAHVTFDVAFHEQDGGEE